MESTQATAPAQVRRSVFRMLFTLMIAFGILVGLVFPPFAALVLGTRRALAPDFFVMCVTAGFLVGLINFLLFRVVVSRQLAHLASGMRRVLERVSRAEQGGDINGEWKLTITSNDAIGEIEVHFNEMTGAIARRLNLEGFSRELHTRMSSSVEMSEVSAGLLQALIRASAAQAGLLFGNFNGEFRLIDNAGIDRGDELPDILDEDLGSFRQAVASNALLTIAPLTGAPPWLKQSSPLGSFAPGGVVVVPLQFEQQPVGLAVLALPGESLTRMQSERVEIIRNQFASYLQNAILHSRVRDLAALDGLTGILNRRFGLRRLEEIAAQAFRHGTAFSVLMLDIDHFKRLNDTFGHDAGDAVLRRISSDFSSTIRGGDVACRYGGEEFMVALAGTGFEDAVRVAERLRRKIAAHEIEWRQRRLSVTASIGLVTWPMTRASTPEELVTAADRALYAAKEAGRDRIFVTLEGRTVPAAEATAG